MGKHILIVGGAESPEPLMRALQTQPGWENEWVQQSEQAIEAWMRQRPDAVIVSGNLDADQQLKLTKVFEACGSGSCVFTWVPGEESGLVARIRETFQQLQLARLGRILVTDTLHPGNLSDEIRLVS